MELALVRLETSLARSGVPFTPPDGPGREQAFRLMTRLLIAYGITPRIRWNGTPENLAAYDEYRTWKAQQQQPGAEEP